MKRYQALTCDKGKANCRFTGKNMKIICAYPASILFTTKMSPFDSQGKNISIPTENSFFGKGYVHMENSKKQTVSVDQPIIFSSKATPRELRLNGVRIK
jgi:hypothetical protein